MWTKSILYFFLNEDLPYLIPLFVLNKVIGLQNVIVKTITNIISKLPLIVTVICIPVANTHTEISILLIYNFTSQMKKKKECECFFCNKPFNWICRSHTIWIIIQGKTWYKLNKLVWHNFFNISALLKSEKWWHSP